MIRYYVRKLMRYNVSRNYEIFLTSPNWTIKLQLLVFIRVNVYYNTIY